MPRPNKQQISRRMNVLKRGKHPQRAVALAEPVVTEAIGNDAIILTDSDEDEVMPIEDPEITFVKEDPGFSILTEDDDVLSESGCSSTESSPEQDYDYESGSEVDWETLSDDMEHEDELLSSDEEDEATDTETPDAVTEAVPEEGTSQSLRATPFTAAAGKGKKIDWDLIDAAAKNKGKAKRTQQRHRKKERDHQK